MNSLDELDLRLMSDCDSSDWVQTGDDWLQLYVLKCWTGGLGWQNLRFGLHKHRNRLTDLSDVGEGSMLGLLVDIVTWFRVFLLVVDEAAGIRSSPGASVTLVRMFSSVSSPVVDKIVRSLELFTTKVTSVAKLSFVDQLMFLQRMFQFECHSTIFTCKVSDV